MRTLAFVFSTLIILSFSAPQSSYAQVVKIKKREYKQAVRLKKRELSRKDYSTSGTGSIELYVKKAINQEFATDDNGAYINTVVYTSAVDPTYEGAVTACRAAARAAIAGNIETRVAELVKRSLNTEQISMKSASGINQTITAGKQLIAQKVSLSDTYVLYREIKDEKDGKTLIEVEYAGSFDNKLALESVQKYVREQMKNETEELHKDLDKIFKLD